MVKDSYYTHRYGISFFKKYDGLYNAYQGRGPGLPNRYELGVCIYVRRRYVWFFLPFDKKYGVGVGSTRVEAVRASMGDWIETYDHYADQEDTAE